MSGLHKYPIVHEIHYNVKQSKRYTSLLMLLIIRAHMTYGMAMSNIYAEIMNSGFMNEAHCHGVKSIPQE
ncbi:uncharacterized protein PHALS_15088 [Plasmopara halstedii]|uniref:Uncharacterized protein n=1 Tax=Plasmopara halstedii TaxID=4781 RepID=A0A0P1AZQ8_PLAHL|nr:uncharacterized protein PHALS_15088 [Plasmopara halstedii]CEG47920.1 hypothetical protein PHALS_15088 [Plasmopara halstedii]|eukprot:XP_024584289.1 hypothetical protein PHALS_15088 [Plasmopara halstedii]